MASGGKAPEPHRDIPPDPTGDWSRDPLCPPYLQTLATPLLSLSPVTRAIAGNQFNDVYNSVRVNLNLQCFLFQISRLCNVIYRKLDFARYPGHVRNLYTYAFKPIIIHVSTYMCS